METDQGNPFRLAAFQAEPPQGLFSIMEVLDHHYLPVTSQRGISF